MSVSKSKASQPQSQSLGQQSLSQQPKQLPVSPSLNPPQPNLVLGFKRTGPGELALLKQNDNGQWEVLNDDLFAIIQGKIVNHIYTEVFLK